MKKENLFYLRLISLIQKSQKSVNQIERELGYPRNSLHNYKDGKDPSGKRLVELARYFKVSPDYLIGMSNLSYPKKIFEELDTNQKKEMYLLCQEWIFSEELESINRL